MKQINEKQHLLEKPIWQMTGEEFLQLNELTKNSSVEQTQEKVRHYAHGIGELSEMLGCCQSTVYTLKKQGVLDAAIVSQIGKRIVFDVEKARVLTDEYQRDQRESRRELK